jgi:hypothetical protein
MRSSQAVPISMAEGQREYVRRSARKVNTVSEDVIRLVEEMVEETYERTSSEAMEFNRKITEITLANMHAYFELLRDLASVRSPLELAAVCSKHTGKQFEALRGQCRELFELTQKAAIENMGPVGLSMGNALIGRPDLV